MQLHPVQLQIERTVRPRRIHVVLRLFLMLALGTVSLGAFSWMAYLALPPLVALAILQRGAGRYHAEDGPRVVRGLRWLAGACAYLSLLTDVPPTVEPGPVELHVEVIDGTTPTAALLRLLYSLPALSLVIVLSALAGVFWLVGAISILAVERLPTFVRDFLALTLRTQLRLLAYHLSLVDAYPSLSEGRGPVVHAHT